jgi:hypothetical protein
MISVLRSSLVNSATQGLVGQQVYSSDRRRVGEIKETVPGDEYVIIRRFPFVKLGVPIKALERSGGRLTVARAFVYLDMAPYVGTKRGLSTRGKARLDEFFALRNL